jgi:cytochrome c peroxidase
MAACLAFVLFALEATFAAAVQSQTRALDEPIRPIERERAEDSKRVELGERLFRDARLSRDNTHSCASCHDLTSNGASANVRDSVIGGQLSRFNTPTVFNAALSFRLNWEGRFRSLEKQAEAILSHPAIMTSSAAEAARKLSSDAALTRQFREAYGRTPDASAIVDALAAFQRSLLTPASRFDRWLSGDSAALTREEIAGYQQFKSLGCISCHQGVNVGGNLFQKARIFQPLTSGMPEVLRVPSLRNVAATAPYFHDGSAATIVDAVKVMGIAQLDRVLTDSEVAALVAFLSTLTGTYRGEAIHAPAAGDVRR